MSNVFDATPCELGEGPLWHPERQQLFWFDVNAFRLLTQEGGKTRIVQFNEYVSAAGWVSDTELLIASESRLFLFDIDRERKEDVEGLESDNLRTRSNDGRGDPFGGFWIGTMGKDKAKGAGAIYRYYDGALRQLYSGVTIPNAICFAPGGKRAYFTDTPTQKVMAQSLDADGWPEGEAEVFLDLRDAGLFPDGAVVDADGNFWNAQWGAWRVACYSPEGEFLRAVGFDAANTSCPAFGGADLSRLYCTSAREELSEAALGRSDKHGMTFEAPEVGRGQAEHRVQL
ncbi:MAG: SMP-30/gluconolactonase/LRE family protein [Silicimonas sp.]|nr:SMP-30/gluconolactonase/LRE family protein [Silicimonas sp.]